MEEPEHKGLGLGGFGCCATAAAAAATAGPAGLRRHSPAAPAAPAGLLASKALRRLDSLSPASLDMISGPLMRKKNAPVSLATALQGRVGWGWEGVHMRVGAAG